MNHYEESFNNHPLHSTMGALKAVIDGNEVDFGEGLEADTFSRVQNVVNFLETLLKRVSSDLVTTSALDNINSQLGVLNTSFQSFQTDKNASNLSVQCETVLNQIVRLPVYDAETGGQQFLSLILNYQKKSDRALADFAELKQSMMNAQVSAATEIASFKEQLETYEIQLAEHKKESEATKLANQSDFDSAKAKNQSAFHVEEEARKTKHADFLKSSQTKVDELLSSLIEKAKALETELEEKLNRAKKIVGLIGNTGMTGHFQKVANRDWWSAEMGQSRLEWVNISNMDNSQVISF